MRMTSAALGIFHARWWVQWNALWLLFCLFFGVDHPSMAIAASRPNVIWIMADDLGFGELGCYGQKHILTPRLDQMAAQGMRFTQFYAGSTVCAPSRSVLMTGQHAGHTRVRGNASSKDRTPQNLQPEDLTVAALLKQKGYATALVGKWGLGVEGDASMPTRLGFDFFFGYLDQVHAHNSWPEFLIRNEQRISLRNRIQRDGKAYEAFGAGLAIDKIDYAPHVMIREALGWIERNREHPFFLYFSPILPHANNELQAATKAGQESDGFGPYASKPWSEQDKAHAAAISCLDDEVGQILDKLTQLELDDRTVVFFTSDNGPHKEGGHRLDFFQPSGPLRGIKRDLYEGGIRVPLIARWPGHIRPDSITEHVGYFGDLMATAAQLAGTQPPKNTDSISLVPVLTGRTRSQKQHPYLYWEFHERGFHQAVRWQHWKGIRLGTHQPIQLYNLRQDLAEAHDVAAFNPEVAKKMEQIMGTARSESKHWPVRESND
jgi:arylsulfatase A-like enzyme